MTARLADVGIRSDLPDWLLVTTTFLIAGAAWGAALDRLTRTGRLARMTLAGALAYGAAATVVALNAGLLDRAIEAVPRELPLDARFAVVFAAAVLGIGGVVGLALGAAAHAEEGALSVGAIGAAAAAIVGLAVVAGLQWLGVMSREPMDAIELEQTTAVGSIAAACAFGAPCAVTLAALSRRRRAGVARGTGRAGVSRRR